MKKKEFYNDLHASLSQALEIAKANSVLENGYSKSSYKIKGRNIEQTVKNGVHNQIIKYTIKGCETEKVKVNSSGKYVFGDKSFSKQA